MTIKSDWERDLKAEQWFSGVLDNYYYPEILQKFNNIEGYNRWEVERTNDMGWQQKGVDLFLIDNKRKGRYFIDEKAQLSWATINKTLPTFAFELGYKKDNIIKIGWLLDDKKKTDYYYLFRHIHGKAYERINSFIVDKVKVRHLKKYLNNLGLGPKFLSDIANKLMTGLDITKDLIEIQAKKTDNIKRYEFNKIQGKLKKCIRITVSPDLHECPVNLVIFIDWIAKEFKGNQPFKTRSISISTQD